MSFESIRFLCLYNNYVLTVLYSSLYVLNVLDITNQPIQTITIDQISHNSCGIIVDNLFYLSINEDLYIYKLT